MTRIELEELCHAAIESGSGVISLRIHGSPDNRRMRLLGHHFGPYGRVSDWRGSDVRVDFDAQVALGYLDTLSVDVISGSDDIAAAVWTEAAITPPAEGGEGA